MNVRNLHKESGSGLVEVLIAMSILAVTGLSVSWNAMHTLRYQKITEIANSAKNLAVSKAEALAGVRIDLLDDSYDATETNLSDEIHSIRFTRITNVTVNADGSRTIDVSVSSSSQYLPKSAHYSTTFAPWES